MSKPLPTMLLFMIMVILYIQNTYAAQPVHPNIVIQKFFKLEDGRVLVYARSGVNTPNTDSRADEAFKVQWPLLYRFDASGKLSAWGDEKSGAYLFTPEDAKAVEYHDIISEQNGTIYILGSWFTEIPTNQVGLEVMRGRIKSPPGSLAPYNDNKYFIKKLSPNGKVDKNFGDNGILSLEKALGMYPILPSTSSGGLGILLGERLTPAGISRNSKSGFLVEFRSNGIHEFFSIKDNGELDELFNEKNSLSIEGDKTWISKKTPSKFQYIVVSKYNQNKKTIFRGYKFPLLGKVIKPELIFETHLPGENFHAHSWKWDGGQKAAVIGGKFFEGYAATFDLSTPKMPWQEPVALGSDYGKPVKVLPSFSSTHSSENLSLFTKKKDLLVEIEFIDGAWKKAGTYTGLYTPSFHCSDIQQFVRDAANKWNMKNL